ncbi:hypothetical protein EBB79_02960 [Parasedimentitalea marina]|uniref:Uncharacterized protein n=1 Tax=Parasedimentitalea marina TaxID=2483033 RepID=A0A3T0MYV5_9RHOB|nr:hypothetical protein [Parasedimentitalea marina]AZV76956.1 hypothetical protein EBB79_02960 [Parasedimentitalea marina]
MFLGLQEVSRAFFSKPEQNDAHTQHAIDILKTAKDQPLRFFGRDETDAIETAVRILAEHGTELGGEERLKVVTALKEMDDVRRLRQRVVVQVAITIVLLAFSLTVAFGAISASDQLQKLSFGLIGTVVGFWLK